MVNVCAYFCMKIIIPQCLSLSLTPFCWYNRAEATSQGPIQTMKQCKNAWKVTYVAASSTCYWIPHLFMYYHSMPGLPIIFTALHHMRYYMLNIIYRDMQDIWGTSETAQPPLPLHHLWHQPAIQVCRRPLWPQLPCVRFNWYYSTHWRECILHSHMYNYSSPVCQL